MAWRLTTISSGHFSLDNNELEPEAIPKVLDLLKRELGSRLSFSGKLGIDVSAAAAEISVDGARLTIGWDNWSGAYIMAWDDSGDSILEYAMREIFSKYT